MCEAAFSLAVLSGDLKDNVRVFPLGFVLDKVDLAIHNMPDNFLIGYPFSDLLRAVVIVPGVEPKFGPEVASLSLNVI